PGAYREVTDLSVMAMFKVCAADEQTARTKAAAAQNPALPTSSAALQSGAFKSALETGPLYFLAWTTTPWTLPSNTALAVNPAYTYNIIETLNKYSGARVFVILAEGLVAEVFNKTEFAEFKATWDSEAKTPIPYRVAGSISGKDLLGIWYEQLLPWTT